MRVFVAGASGAIGRRLVPLLLQANHEVIGTSRTGAGLARLQDQGAEGVRVDVFDAAALREAVAAARPDVVVHQLTALADGNVADNARIRREGTRNLVDAARAAGVSRIVAQSIAWAYEPGDGPAREDVPLDLAAPEPRATSVGGVAALERAAGEVDVHVTLRFGTLYGPGTWYSADGSMGRRLAAGELPASAGVSSFVHVDDAARATVEALQWPSGPVNVVDDEPASGRDWVPALAEALGAPPPERDGAGAAWERGADNALARERGWRPTFASWREGFATLR